MKTLPLTQGKVALVDDDVYAWASQYKWYANKKKQQFYAARRPSQRGGSQKLRYLHRDILKPGVGQEVDHVNGDALDNQRKNLRVVTVQQNKRAYRRVKRIGTSVFRGVFWDKRNKKWTAAITLNSQSHYLGLFELEEAAARAYDRAAWKFFGKFAQFNFPRPWLKTKS